MKWLIPMLLAIGQVVCSARADSYVPPSGFVPDETTAVRIAEAILEPIYGAAIVNSEKPLKATLKDGIWTVKGSLPKGKLGGVAIVEIAMKDGRIEHLEHGT